MNEPAEKKKYDLPEVEVTVPDDIEGLVTPRHCRKQAQHAIMHAIQESAGRPGLTEAEKIGQMEKMHDFLSEALSAVELGLALMKSKEE